MSQAGWNSSTAVPSRGAVLIGRHSQGEIMVVRCGSRSASGKRATREPRRSDKPANPQMENADLGQAYDPGSNLTLLVRRSPALATILIQADRELQTS